MKCPKCGSEQVHAQVVSETSMVTKHKGVLYWIFVGWWWIPIKWITFAVPALIGKLFHHKRYKMKTKHITKFVCDGCGHTWNA